MVVDAPQRIKKPGTPGKTTGTDRIKAKR